MTWLELVRFSVNRSFRVFCECALCRYRSGASQSLRPLNDIAQAHPLSTQTIHKNQNGFLLFVFHSFAFLLFIHFISAHQCWFRAFARRIARTIECLLCSVRITYIYKWICVRTSVLRTVHRCSVPNTYIYIHCSFQYLRLHVMRDLSLHYIVVQIGHCPMNECI